MSNYHMESEHKPKHLVKGEKAEDRALEFLLNKGLIKVDRNYRCKQGEIDLIMHHQSFLVMVEVRYRNDARYGSALETVTLKKQTRIIAAAYHYLMAKKITDQPIRFDVVGITGEDNFNWVQNAFMARF